MVSSTCSLSLPAATPSFLFSDGVEEKQSRILANPMPHPVEISWSPPPASWLADWRRAEEAVAGSPPVHVWAIPLTFGSSTLEELQACLSPDEAERAARFHFPLHRDRFIAGHGVLRLLLSRYLGTRPASLEFTHSANGKPSLQSQDARLHFNLAHSDDLALLAVSAGAPLGVDVERIRPLRDAEDLVARFFSPRESAAFSALPEEQKTTAFFNLWTRKEAWLKATGEGIAHSLHLVEVSFLPGEAAQLSHLPAELATTADWRLHNLAPATDFVGALALNCADQAVNCWRVEI
jgi:4'-phosphopantetheinyl transferase